jgi:hypothetical protein
MTDYHPLITRAVNALEKNSGEARRSLYERARTALVTQLRAAEPALSESEITKERLALEEAIRRVEAEAARKLRTEPRDQRPATPPRSAAAEPRGAPVSPPPPPPPPRRERANPPAPEPARAESAAPRATEPAWPAPGADQAETAEAPRPLTAREKLLGSRTPSLTREGIKGFRDVVSAVRDLGGATARATRSARDTRNPYEASAAHDAASTQHLPAAEEDVELAEHVDLERQGLEPQVDGYDAYEQSRRHESTPLLRSLEPSYGVDEEQPAASQYARPHPPHAAVSEEEYEPPRPPRSYRGLIKPLVVVLILLGVAGTISWQWPAISEFYQLFARGAKQQTTQAAPEAPAPQPKFPGRVPQENAGQGPAAGAQPNPAPPAVAQRVVLYEEDPNDPAGKRYVGSAIWRTETVSPGAGLAPELAVRADVEIPERRMSMTWSLRRNTDKALPASHTIEILFKLPADFPGGGIGNVPGILMKEAEQARGTPLAGLAVKVTNGFFLIGLSAAENDMQRNIALLKDRQWFDIPVVYANGGRAILAMEKGPPGDRAFAEAFAAWEKK